MDPLTQAVELLRPQSLLWKQLDAAGDWIVRFPRNNGVVFSLVTSGRCHFRSDAHGSRELSEGDALVLMRPSEWSLSDGRSETPSEIDVQNGPGVRFARIGVSDCKHGVQIVGGRFRFSEVNRDLLDDLLPPFLVISRENPVAGRLRGVLQMIADEAVSERPGRGLALHRLLELMLLELMRHDPSRVIVRRGGLLAGLADTRLAPAVRAMHSEVRRPWTVADLAKLSGMSRSTFAERFGRIVGLPPIDYLLRWRMALAKDALSQRRERLADIAEQTGYQSVSAFSAAFTRTVGRPPSRFLREAAPVKAGHT